MVQLKNELHIKIDRLAFSQEHFNDVSSYSKPRVNRIQRFFRSKISSCQVAQWIRQTFPICDWLPQYNWKVDLPCDIIAGFTIAVMHIPQGLAYALLANVPAVVGIYMAFFPNIPYIFLSTSRHNSMGTFAVVTLLVGRSVLVYANNPDYVHAFYSTVNGTKNIQYVPYTPLEIGTSLTLLTSFWHLLMYFLRLGITCELLSDALINSFICGAGVHIFTSQIKEILGVKTKIYTGPLQLVYTYIDIFQKLIYATPQEKFTTYSTLSISAVCITILLLNMYLLKPFLKKYTRIPFPCELLIIIAAVFAAKGLELNANYNTPHIGLIKKGIPGPIFPYLNLIKELLLDSFVTAVVAYAVSMSMALILAEDEDYEVDANQELLAHGVGNFVGAIFSCIVFCTSLSRSMVLKSAGGKTQLTAFFAAIIIVIVLLWIADFFQPLSKCVLACILIVALQKILMQVTDLPKFWRKSRLDGIVWITVFLSVILIDIDYGLGIGFIISIGIIFFQGLKSYTCILGNVPDTAIYLDVDRYKAVSELDGIKIVHYRGALNFATRSHLKLEVMRLTGINPQQELKKKNKLEKKRSNGSSNQSEGTPEYDRTSEDNHGYDPDFPDSKISYIVLDFSALSGIDPAGAAQVKKLRDKFKHIGITILISGCVGPLYESIKRCKYLDGDDPLLLFPTTHDAVRHAVNGIAEKKEEIKKMRTPEIRRPSVYAGNMFDETF